MWGIILSSLYQPRVNKNRFLIPYIYILNVPLFSTAVPQKL